MTMIITKGATADGSMMVTQSDIAEYSDGYVNPLPARPQDPNPASTGHASDWLAVTNYRSCPTSYDLKF
jgi:dipeptidase